jgi:hypothetical protein
MGMPLNVSVSIYPVFSVLIHLLSTTIKIDYGKEKSKRRDAAGVCTD